MVSARVSAKSKTITMIANFLIIGSGISGLNFALHAAKKGEVIIVTKKKIIDSNTNYAQGGIAAVLDKTDNFKAHVKDTLEAGAYHNDKKAVEFMVKNSPAAIYRLIDLGVEFENNKGDLKLTREGGHNKRRIAYVGDHTGSSIEKVLVKRVKEHPNITVLENAFAIDLIIKNKICYGCSVLRKNKIINIFSHQTILATGGSGQIFSETTNPKIATGDGLAMGIRAGCKTKDLEFIQFHPTALAKKTSPRFLLSETLRGEGAKIIDEKGNSIMQGCHPLGDLAPRDIVAREIYKHQKIGNVYLDIRHKKSAELQKRFPQIYEQLKKSGYDLSKDIIPITPAAHYQCGGIVTNLKGETGIKNLFAFGEVTCTGVHGANRLASNSLLEALVFSNQISENLQTKSPKIIQTPEIKLIKKSGLKYKNDIQKLMWNYAGIVRNIKKITTEAIPKLKKINNQLTAIQGTNQSLAEARNMAQVAMLILKSAAKRAKPLGCHFTE